MPTKHSSIQKFLEYLHQIFRKPGNIQAALCTGCLELFDLKKLITAPCGHSFCFRCSRRMAKTALDSLELFPAKCCTREIPPEAIAAALGFRMRKRYIFRWEEHKTSPVERLYCPRASCGQWIPLRSPASRIGGVLCPHCRAKICPNCRDFYHSGWSCGAQKVEMRLVLEMARKNNWQRCSRCLYLVEKIDGCNKIVCRCGNQFCYVCGERGGCECSSRDVGDGMGTVGGFNVDTIVAAIGQAELTGQASWWADEA